MPFTNGSHELTHQLDSWLPLSPAYRFNFTKLMQD